MASLYKVGRTYYIYCRFRGRRFRLSTGFKNKDAAKRVLLNVEMRLAEGNPPWATSGPSLVSLLEGYLKHYQKRVVPTTMADRKRYLKRFTEHFGNDMPITEISRTDAMDYKAARLDSGAGNVVINREMATIRHYFNYAIDRGICEENPFKRFKALPEPRRDPRILSKEEAKTWFKWCHENDRLLYDLSIIAFYTGLRPSDTKKIKGSHVNIRGCFLIVSVSKLRNTITLTIPLRDRALNVLRRRKREYGDGYLFPGRVGEHITSFRRRVNEAREETGLTDFTFGQFRHNCATFLLEAGVSIYHVKEILGHASVRTTERYVKLVGNAKLNAVNQLPDFGLPYIEREK